MDKDLQISQSVLTLVEFALEFNQDLDSYSIQVPLREMPPEVIILSFLEKGKDSSSFKLPFPEVLDFLNGDKNVLCPLDENVISIDHKQTTENFRTERIIDTCERLLAHISQKLKLEIEYDTISGVDIIIKSKAKTRNLSLENSIGYFYAVQDQKN
jgi:hypothetical protein